MEAPVEEPVYDCERCGACCRAQPGFGGGAYVRLAPGDEERFTRRQAHEVLTRTSGGRRALRLIRAPEGHLVCAALAGRVGERVSCSVYAARPQVCRDFAPGTAECELARQEAGLPPTPPLLEREAPSGP